jgi:long-chain acyl-CoA synthetase
MAKATSLPSVPLNKAVTSEHICAIIYTSGTTGKPKGVELAHRCIAAQVHGLNGLWKYEGGLLQSQTSLAFLPWAHVFGMTCELHHFTANGKFLGSLLL